jgi:NADH-quinone oxidoreductase subunit N
VTTGFEFLASLPAIAPEVGLTILAVVVLFLDIRLPESQRRNLAIVTGVGMFATAILYLLLWFPVPIASAPADAIIGVTTPAGLGAYEGLYWGGMMRHDSLAQIFKVMVLCAGALTALMAIDTKNLGRKGEFYLIIIVSSLGGCLIAGASDLIMLFLGLETMTIPLYVLAAFNRNDKRSPESGMKYFLFGSFASAILLYGLSLLYGFTGSTSFAGIAASLQSDTMGNNGFAVLVALTLIIVGFGFKISAAPFHFWTPDVYEGAPTPVTAFLSVSSKAASFALLLRFLIAVFPSGLVIGGVVIPDFWVNLVAALAVISMILGNVVALAQRNIKRMLAYSSIAQAGYTLIGIAALGTIPMTGDASVQTIAQNSVAAISFYMFMYTFTNILAFAVVVIFSEATGSEDIKDLAGLSRRNPWLALTMTIGLLSLAGVPPAAGFFGKFFLFQAAVQAGLVWLALLGVLMSIVALYYYLTVVKVMYVDRGVDEDKPIVISTPVAWVLGLSALAVVLLGTVLVTPVFDWALLGFMSMVS